MIVTLQTQRVQTLEQVRRVAEGNEPVDFAFAERASAYEFIGRTLVQSDYAGLGKADKGAVKAYLGKMTGLSRAQLTRLMAQHRSTRRLRDRRSAGPSRPFARCYTAADIRLLGEVDTALGQRCGPATRAVFATTYPGINAFRKGVDEFCIYVRRNADTIPNYAERYRYGERVSTGFAESTLNAVVGKRLSKRQQMRWPRRGARLMLQTRRRGLDDTLRAKFQSWYPGLFHVHNAAPQSMSSPLDPTDLVLPTSSNGSSPNAPATASPQRRNEAEFRDDRYSIRKRFRRLRNSSKLVCRPREQQNTSVLGGQRLTESPPPCPADIFRRSRNPTNKPSDDARSALAADAQGPGPARRSSTRGSCGCRWYADCQTVPTSRAICSDVRRHTG